MTMTTVDMIRLGEGDASPWVREAAVRHPNAPVEVIRQGAEDEDPGVGREGDGEETAREPGTQRDGTRGQEGQEPGRVTEPASQRRDRTGTGRGRAADGTRNRRE